jgi:dynein regulatory complex subunit 2
LGLRNGTSFFRPERLGLFSSIMGVVRATAASPGRSARPRPAPPLTSVTPRSPLGRRASARVVHASLKLRGGAQLGKAVKGRSKDGKGGKNEGTEEERRLQESIRRMEMNDYLKKLTLSKKALLHEFMAKEDKISRMNKLKIQNHWRKIMRLVKVESLRKDVEIRSQNHERDVDRKDAVIQMLDRDLEEAEEQFQMALRSHLLDIDAFIDLQDDRLLGLEKEFERDLRELEQEFTAEKLKITAQHSAEKHELVRIMGAVEQQEKEKEAEARQEHEQLREEIRNKNLEDINVLRITLDR